MTVFKFFKWVFCCARARGKIVKSVFYVRKIIVKITDFRLVREAKRRDLLPGDNCLP